MFGSLNKFFYGRRFEAYSVITKKSLSKPSTYDEAWDAVDRLGNGNGIDVREVT